MNLLKEKNFTVFTSNLNKARQRSWSLTAGFHILSYLGDGRVEWLMLGRQLQNLMNSSENIPSPEAGGGGGVS